jgi:hypothetical protein
VTSRNTDVTAEAALDHSNTYRKVTQPVPSLVGAQGLHASRLLDNGKSLIGGTSCAKHAAKENHEQSAK